MTFDELGQELSLIGISGGDELTVAINRALADLYGQTVIERSVRLAVRSYSPVKYYKELCSVNGKRVDIPVPAGAYSMRIHGNGQFMLADGDSYTVTSVNTGQESKVYKGFVSEGGSLTFWGSFTFYIYDLALYDKIYSARVEDIPEYGAKQVIDLRRIYGDFLSFLSPATDGEGNTVEVCRLYDGKIELPSSYTGEITLRYRRTPTYCSGYDNEDIDLPYEYRHVFTLLVCYYALLYCDPQMAEKFKADYDGNMATLREQCYTRLDNEYRIENGWA